MKNSTVNNRESNQYVAVARQVPSADKRREPLGPTHNILDQLAMPEVAEIDLDIDRAQDLPRPVDLS